MRKNIFRHRYNFYKIFYNIVFFIFSSFLGFSYNQVNAFAAIEKLLNVKKPVDLVKTDSRDTKIKNQLQVLNKNKENLASPEKYKKKLEEISNSIIELKQEASKAKDQERKFLQEKILLLNQKYQTLSEIDRANAQLLDIVNNNIKILCEYRFNQMNKSKNTNTKDISKKALYNFEEVQKIYNNILDYESELKDLNDKQNKISLDLTHKKRAAYLAGQEYEEKTKEQLQFVEQDQDNNEDNELNIQQRADILDNQEELAKYKEKIANLRVKELEFKSALIDTKIKAKKEKLHNLQETYERVKHFVHIDEAQLKKMQKSVDRNLQKITRNQREYTAKSGALQMAYDSAKNTFEKLKEHYEIPSTTLKLYEDWSYQPETLEEWESFTDIGELYNKLNLNVSNKRKLEAQLTLDKAQYEDEKVQSAIMSTWSKLTSKKDELESQAEIGKEIKHYNNLKAQIESDLYSIPDKQSAIALALNNNSKMRDNIKIRIKELKKSKAPIFKDNLKEYNKIFSKLKDAEKDLEVRAEILSKINELYILITDSYNTTIKKIDGMVNELKSKAQWTGVARSIGRGIINFIPDISHFLGDTYAMFMNSKDILNTSYINKLFNNKDAMYSILSLVLQFAIAMLVFILVKLYLPDFTSLIQTVSSQ